MPEELKPDPVLEKLAYFTPVNLDRDTMLFEAGRASAKASPVWKWLVGLLAASHLAWFAVFLWPQEQVVRTVSVPTQRPVPASPSSDSPAMPENAYFALKQRFLKQGEMWTSTAAPSAGPASSEPLTADLRKVLQD